ncbi:MAG TPA: hypothetical protein VNV85_05240 [Puia sp.]|jgi:hypothetical protein|nr:hypothetical protein [Puia sp.]
MEKNKTHSDDGRSYKRSKRNVHIDIHVTKTEQFVLKEKASKTGLSLSRYLREIGIKADLKMRLSEEDRDKLNGLIGMSNNLNQLCMLAQQKGLLKIASLLVDLRDKIDRLLNHIERD